MSKIEDLNSAVSALTAVSEAILVKVEELKLSGTSLDPQVEAATVKVNEVTGKLKAKVDELAVPA